MLEKSANDGDNANILRETRNARSNAADAAHDELNFDPGLGRAIERGADGGVVETVHLGDDGRRSSL